MATWRPLTLAEREQIISLRRAGGYIIDIAKQIDRPQSTVRDCLRKAGLIMRMPLRVSPEILARREEMCRLYGSGWSISNIARQLKIEWHKVRDALADAGIREFGGETVVRLRESIREEIAKRFAAGETPGDIARAMKRDPSIVYRALDRMGLRKPGEPRMASKPKAVADEPKVQKEIRLPVAESEWLRAPTREQLMAGR